MYFLLFCHKTNSGEQKHHSWFNLEGHDIHGRQLSLLGPSNDCFWYRPNGATASLHWSKIGILGLLLEQHGGDRLQERKWWLYHSGQGQGAILCPLAPERSELQGAWAQFSQECSWQDWNFVGCQRRTHKAKPVPGMMSSPVQALPATCFQADGCGEAPTWAACTELSLCVHGGVL